MSARIKLSVVLITLFALVASVGALPVFASTVDHCTAGADFMTQGQQTYAAGDYRMAVRHFTCAIAENAGNYVAYLGRMQAALLAGQYGQAVSDANVLKDYAPDMFQSALDGYSVTISANPNDVSAYMLRAMLLWASARDEEALPDYDTILQLDPNNTFAYLFRGSSLQYLGDRLMPPDDFAAAIRLSPQNADVYGVIGSTYTQTGDFSLAVRNLTEAINLDPNNSRAYYFLGLAHLHRNNLDEAVTNFTRSIEIDPTYVEPYYDRGLAYARQGDYEAALTDFDTTLALNDSFRLAYLNRGVVYELVNDKQSALLDYARYVDLNQLRGIAGEPLMPGLPVRLDMADGYTYTLPVVAQAGQMLEIQAVSPNELSDPLILLFDPQGNPVAGNDDQVIGRFDAVIEGFEVPQTGTYTLVVTHSDGGFRGFIEVLMNTYN